MPARTFDHYELLEKINHMRGGEVYKARELATSREVLLRLLPPEIAAALRGEGHNAEEEGRIAALVHPNLLTVYEFHFCNGHPFVASELFDGYTLAERLLQGPLPLEEVLTIASAVGAGLQYAHEHGVVHGHLNPEHIWLSPRGDVKVANLGFHRLRNGVAQDLLGREARRYEAPELLQGAPATRAGDVFSFGLILQEMLVGEGPQRDPRGRIAIDLSTFRTDDRRAGISERVHPALGELVRNCTQNEPDERLQSFDEIHSELVAADALYTEPSLKYEYRSPNPFWRAQLWRRHFMATMVVIIALAGLLTAVGLVLFR